MTGLPHTPLFQARRYNGAGFQESSQNRRCRHGSAWRFKLCDAQVVPRVLGSVWLLFPLGNALKAFNQIAIIRLSSGSVALSRLPVLAYNAPWVMRLRANITGQEQRAIVAFLKSAK